jgi:hypothetical protein
MRILLLLVIIWIVLLTKACSMAIPKRCEPGYEVEKIRTDLGPLYICAKKSP